MISAKNLVKKYGNNTILDDVSLEIQKERITAIIGSNGAGKSTLLSILARTLDKNSGEIKIDEKIIESWDTKELSKRLSILKQANNINVKLTVRELVSFGRFPYSEGKLTKEDENKIAESISYMGLEYIENRYIDELSGGQKQMAYIAMIIAQDTEYIFLDEPLNNLDMKHAVGIMKILKKLVNEKKKTIVVVIHEINFVSCYADHILAIKNGKIIQNSKSDDVIENKTLKEIYGIDMNITTIDDKKYCLYY